MIFILFCVFGIIHLCSVVTQSLMFGKYKEKELNSQQTERLSLIVAARNEEENLKKLVPKLLNQDYSNFEIIIALDRCTDNSKSYLESLEDSRISFINIIQFEEGWNAKKFALKTAISKAKGDWVVFTDADCLPESEKWLASVNSQIAPDKDIIIGVSPYRTSGDFLSTFIQYEAFITAFTYISKALMGRPYMAVGRNMAIRKSFFLSSGGYEEFKSVLGGDDDLFIQKNATSANSQVISGPESLVYTQPKTSWKDYWNQKVRHLSVGTRYRIQDVLLLNFLQVCHTFFIILLFFNTTHSFFFPVLLFYLFIKLVSYRFAAGKMGIHINYMWLPLVDVIYALLIPVIAVWSQLEKDIKWKN